MHSDKKNIKGFNDRFAAYKNASATFLPFNALHSKYGIYPFYFQYFSPYYFVIFLYYESHLFPIIKNGKNFYVLIFANYEKELIHEFKFLKDYEFIKSKTIIQRSLPL